MLCFVAVTFKQLAEPLSIPMMYSIISCSLPLIYTVHQLLCWQLFLPLFLPVFVSQIWIYRTLYSCSWLVSCPWPWTDGQQLDRTKRMAAPSWCMLDPLLCCCYTDSVHRVHHKVLKSTTVYVPSLELGLSHPLSCQPVCPSPRNKGRGAQHTRLRVRGWGSPNSDDWRKSLALCLLCGMPTVHLSLCSRNKGTPVNRVWYCFAAQDRK